MCFQILTYPSTFKMWPRYILYISWLQKEIFNHERLIFFIQLILAQSYLCQGSGYMYNFLSHWFDATRVRTREARVPRPTKPADGLSTILLIRDSSSIFSCVDCYIQPAYWFNIFRAKHICQYTSLNLLVRLLPTRERGRAYCSELCSPSCSLLASLTSDLMTSHRKW